MPKRKRGWSLSCLTRLTPFLWATFYRSYYDRYSPAAVDKPKAHTYDNLRWYAVLRDFWTYHVGAAPDFWLATKSLIRPWSNRHHEGIRIDEHSSYIGEHGCDSRCAVWDWRLARYGHIATELHPQTSPSLAIINQIQPIIVELMLRQRRECGRGYEPANARNCRGAV